jgi:hypothetical protein
VFHPLAPDLSGMSQDELNKKTAELSSRLSQAYRFGPSGAVQQLQMLQMHYQEELNRRYQKQIEDMAKKNPDFDKIIDIK